LGEFRDTFDKWVSEQKSILASDPKVREVAAEIIRLTKQNGTAKKVAMEAFGATLLGASVLVYDAFVAATLPRLAVQVLFGVTGAGMIALIVSGGFVAYRGAKIRKQSHMQEDLLRPGMRKVGVAEAGLKEIGEKDIAQMIKGLQVFTKVWESIRIETTRIITSIENNEDFSLGIDGDLNDNLESYNHISDIMIAFVNGTMV